MSRDEPRGASRAHGYIDLHDGRRICFGMTMEGWWVTIYLNGRAQGGSRGRDLHEALTDALFETDCDYADVIIPLMGELGMEA